MPLALSGVRLWFLIGLLAGTLQSASAKAATYRLELSSGTSVLATKDFEFSKDSYSAGYQHPQSVGSKMNGLALEIGDSIAACGTFLQFKTKFDAQVAPQQIEVVSAIVTLVEKASIPVKINAETGSADQLDQKTKALSVKNEELDRTCTVKVI